MEKKYENVIKICCIWRGLTTTKQTLTYNNYVFENNLGDLNVTLWEDVENGGQHNWFIFHKGNLTNEPKLIIDDLVEVDEVRIL